MAKTYIPPALPANAIVTNLEPVDTAKDALTPDTLVTCLNRGRTMLTAQFDGRHYEIAPGYFTAAYAAALHFQARLTVPGSRDRELGRDGALRSVSFIAVLGIDHEDDCQPFTADELRAVGLKTEAFDRESMPTAIDRDVTTVATRSVRGKLASQGAGGSRRGQFSRQVVDQASTEAAERARGAFVPSDTSDAEREIAERARER